MYLFQRVVLVIFILVGRDIHSQEYQLLWELTGKDLIGTSYVFGSMHHNADEIFIFHDSLEYAIKSCDAFANEVNFDSIGSYFSNEFFQDFFIGEEPEEPQEGKLTGNHFDFVDINGRETLLDLYLYKIANVLGHDIHGLEPMTEDIFRDEILNAISSVNEEYDYQSDEFRNFLSAYASGDLSSIEELMNQYDFDPNHIKQMITRNRIQANSIIELGRKATTFSVVGAAHLFGADNVLEILRNEGYQVRSVGLGKPTTALDQLYRTKGADPINELPGNIAGYRIQSKHLTRPIKLYDVLDMHMNVSMEGGYILLSMILPSTVTQDSNFQEELIKNIVDDPTLFIEQEVAHNSSMKKYLFETEEELLVMTTEESSNLTAIQFAFCFSKKVLDSPDFLRDLELISFVEETTDWHHQSHKGQFSYLLPNDIEWKVNRIVHPEFPERGEMKLMYKAFVDPNTKDEYLIRFDVNQPGITYLNQKEDLETVTSGLVKRFNASAIEQEYFEMEHGHTGMNLTAIDSLGIKYFFKTMIRGSALYVALEKSVSNVKNHDFFDSFQIQDIELNEALKKLEHQESFLKMDVPNSEYYYHSEDATTPTDHFSYAYESIGTTMDVEIMKYSKYESLAPLDTLHADYTEAITAEADSTLAVKTWNPDSICPLVGVEYVQDSSTLARIQAISYCNDYSYTFIIMGPIEIISEGYVDAILNSVSIDQNPELNYSLSDSKVPLILEDLSSTDTIVFNGAREALNNIESVEDEDREPLQKALTQSYTDDELDYNSAHDIITLLHDFEDDEVEQAIVTHFKTTKNKINRERIIESLSMRSSDHSFERMVGLLETTDDQLVHGDNIYSSAKDSMSVYVEFYDRLLGLAKRDIAYSQFLELNIYYLDSNQISSQLPNQWFEEQIKKETSTYIEQTKIDTAASIDEYLMDYFLSPNSNSELKDILYSNIEISKDYYAKYRMTYNQKLNQEEVNQQQVEEAASIPHYRYWLLSLYSDESVVPSSLMNMELNAISIQKQYLNNNYDVWTDQCKVHQTYDSKSNDEFKMALVGCENSDADNYYMGLVGPIDADGFINIEQEESVYYSKPITQEDFEEIENKLVQYYNEN